MSEDPFGLPIFPYAFKRLSARCAAFIEPNGLSNVGIIEAPEGLVVVDSTLHPYYADEIIRRLAREMCRPVIHLINTHFHRDHTFGNQAFAPEGDVIAHRCCDDYFRRYGPDWLASLSAEYASVELTYPTRTFEGSSYQVEGVSTEIHLLHTGGHTHDSCLVWVPEDGTLFGGDAVFNRVPPYVAQWSCVNHFGRMLDWIDALARIRELRPKEIVPGHGVLATTADVEELQRFFEYYAGTVRTGVDRGWRLREIGRDLLSRSDFERSDLEPDVYLHMTMGLYDELTGPSEWYDK